MCGCQLDADDTHVGDQQALGMISEEVDALRGRYIRRLTAVLIHHVPAFWKVALAVSTGKFAKVFIFYPDASLIINYRVDLLKIFSFELACGSSDIIKF